MPRKRKSPSETKRIKRGLAYQEFVASVVKSMDPGANVETEQWILGPDGIRDRDVLVSGKIDGRNYSVLIECKDFDPKSTGKVGIEYVDALDSKRNDIGVDGAIICSNSGFTEGAIRKAKRKQIGLVSVVKADDSRVKVEIQEEIYTRQINAGSFKINFDVVDPQEQDFPQVELNKITFRGLPIINWVMERIGIVAAFNRTETATMRDVFRFVNPVEIQFGSNSSIIKGFTLIFPLEVKWYSQVVTIDAKLGIYDYIRGKIRFAPGANQYLIKNLDIHNGTPIDFVPEPKELGAGLLPGEIDVALVLINGLDMPPEDQIPPLGDLIIPEDLEWKIKQ